MHAFIKKNLDPATRLGEAMFGLIMALGIVGAVRIGIDEATSRHLLISVLGCNVAWGLVDGVMSVTLALFERGRKSRIVRQVLTAPNEAAAMDCIRAELGDRIEPFTTPDQRTQIYQWVLNAIQETGYEPARIEKDDVLSGVAVALLILVVTLPIIVPFVFIQNPDIAVRVSNMISLLLLCSMGWWWGRIVGANPIGISIGVTGVGLTLVLITIALGG